MEVVNLGGEAEEGGGWRVEVGCQEEEVGMGTRGMMHWAEVVVLVVGQRRYKTLFKKKKKGDNIGCE